MYASDIDTLYRNINNGIITHNDVRIISSSTTQTMQLLQNFPNVEEILCTMILPSGEVNTLLSLIYTRHKLKNISVIIYMDKGIIIKKRRRDPADTSKRLSLYENCLKNDIPVLIHKLGDRLRYMKMNITVVNVYDHKQIYTPTIPFTTISIINGYFCTNDINGLTNNIFNSLKNNLNGVTTTGDNEYDLKDISYIHEVTIVARINDKFSPINVQYLINLVSKADVINIVYDSDTIETRHLYSDILKCGSNGYFKRIKGIVPAIDASDHISTNGNLEEIHILVTSDDDVKDIEYIVKEYNHRLIVYYIHCMHKYFDDISNIANADIILCDIVRTLMI